jgi:hypothetical protein
MIRIFLWRLIFESLSLLKLFGFKGRESHYFAFGGNLDPEVMKKRGMTVLASEPARLDGYILRFNHEVPFEGVGMASIEESGNSFVYGIIYSISKIDEWIMDCYESHIIFNRYRKGRLQINGKDCFFYFSGRRMEGLLPTKAYLSKLITGYKLILGEDSEFVKQLESSPAITEMVPKKPPRFLITNYEIFGKALRPVLEKYDSVCVRIFMYFIFRPSIFS